MSNLIEAVDQVPPPRPPSPSSDSETDSDSDLKRDTGIGESAPSDDLLQMMQNMMTFLDRR